MYSLLSHHPTSCTTGFTPPVVAPRTAFLAGHWSSGKLWIRFDENSPPRAGHRSLAAVGRWVRIRFRLRVRPALRGGLCRERIDSRRARRSPLVRAKRRSAMHAREHPRNGSALAGARRDELGSSTSLGRATPHRCPLGHRGRRRSPGGTLTTRRTTTALTPAAPFGAAVAAFV